MQDAFTAIVKSNPQETFGLPYLYTAIKYRFIDFIKKYYKVDFISYDEVAKKHNLGVMHNELVDGYSNLGYKYAAYFKSILVDRKEGDTDETTLIHEKLDILFSHSEEIGIDEDAVLILKEKILGKNNGADLAIYLANQSNRFKRYYPLLKNLTDEEIKRLKRYLNQYRGKSSLSAQQINNNENSIYGKLTIEHVTQLSKAIAFIYQIFSRTRKKIINVILD